MAKVMRVNYSMLSMFDSGEIDLALRMLSGDYSYTNEYFEAGKKFHKDAEEWAIKYGTFMPQFNIKEKPIWVEKKFVFMLNDWIQMVIKVDSITEDWVVDLKSTTSPDASLTSIVSQNLQKYQLALYNLYLKKKLGCIAAMDLNTGLTKVGFKHMTKSWMKEAKDWAITTAGYVRETAEQDNINFWRNA